MRVGRIDEAGDERMLFEHRLDDPALDALAAAVNQSNLAQTRLVRGAYVFLDHGRDIARRERVQVERSIDRNLMGVVSQPGC